MFDMAPVTLISVYDNIIVLKKEILSPVSLAILLQFFCSYELSLDFIDSAVLVDLVRYKSYFMAHLRGNI